MQAPQPPDPPPQPPVEPEASECCGEGCARCVYDIYDEAMARYRIAYDIWQDRQQAERAATDAPAPRVNCAPR